MGINLPQEQSLKIINDRTRMVYGWIANKPGVCGGELIKRIKEEGLRASHLYSVTEYLEKAGFIAVERIHRSLNLFSPTTKPYQDRDQIQSLRSVAVGRREPPPIQFEGELARFMGFSAGKFDMQADREVYDADEFEYISSGLTVRQGITYGVSNIYANGE